MRSSKDRISEYAMSSTISISTGYKNELSKAMVEKRDPMEYQRGSQISTHQPPGKKGLFLSVLAIRNIFWCSTLTWNLVIQVGKKRNNRKMEKRKKSNSGKVSWTRTNEGHKKSIPIVSIVCGRRENVKVLTDSVVIPSKARVQQKHFPKKQWEGRPVI